MRAAVTFLLIAAFGVSVALVTARPDRAPGREAFVRASLALGASEPVYRPPQVLTPVAARKWPSWLVVSGEGTERKSVSRPVIAIVIDDLGVDEARTRAVMEFPAAVTLSFLPYPPASHALSHAAHEGGHEIIVHLQMEPLGNADPGPLALRVGLSAEELRYRLEWALSRVSDFDGANNHMGSRFTESRDALVPVMKGLASRGLLFLDSRTIGKTKAESVAREAGVLTGARDVFLDDDERATAVERQLAETEAHAMKHGSAIAIGHPHPETIAALKPWLASLEARGFRLVSLKEALQMRAETPP